MVKASISVRRTPIGKLLQVKQNVLHWWTKNRKLYFGYGDSPSVCSLPAEYLVSKLTSSTMKRVAPFPLDDGQPISFFP
mgnify:CR=1 FL=1